MRSPGFQLQISGMLTTAQSQAEIRIFTVFFKAGGFLTFLDNLLTIR
jgi:hypothetical protein